MKCKICGYEITDEDIKCPGCNKNVETLKKDGNIKYDDEIVSNPVVIEDEYIEDKTSILDEPVEDEVIESNEDVEEKTDGIILEEPKEEEIVSEAVDNIVMAEPAEAIEEKTDEIILEELKEEAIEPEAVANDVSPVVIEDTLKVSKKKKKTNKGLLVVLCIIILILAILGYAYFVYMNSINVLKRMYSEITSSLPNSFGDKVQIDVDYNTSKLEGYAISTKNYVDMMSDNIITDITVSKDDVFISSNFVKNGNEIYFLNNDIYDRYVKFDESLISRYDYVKVLSMIINRGEFKNIVNSIDLANLISKDLYKKEYTTITYDQKNMVSTKISYNNNDANEFVRNILLKIRDNKNILNSISKIFNITSDELLLNLNNAIIDVGNDAYKVEYNVYTDYLTKNYYKIEINVTSNNHKYTVNINLSNNSINKIDIRVDNTNIYISNNMSEISINGDVNSNYIYRYNTIASIDSPLLDEYVLYEDVKEEIDNNISNNEDISSLYDVIKIKDDLDVDLVDGETENIDNPLPETNDINIVE